MSRTCLLTLRSNGREWDLEVPSELPSQELVGLLQEALGLPSSEPAARLYLAPLGVPLPQNQNLQQAGVLDGSILILSATAPQSDASGQDLVRDNPATAWKPLGSETPAEPTPPAAPDKPGYVWKKL
ncbi:MAG: EsaB/YukD family protein [Candidatus Eremiobacteraeota bacterium]|nr:EsaB/YukD family protein [Candidatus Eremiobacteraeota bacterium]MCW5866966.1 EsaB/YukD family protein [Candidatus Eremiobacteraeota bacterium]